MDWTHILSSAAGAIFGGGMTGIGAYYSAKSDRTTQAINMNVFKKNLDEFKQDCVLCRGELKAEIVTVKKSIDEHHTNTDRHVTDSFKEMLENKLGEMASRLLSIEVYLRNGGSKKG